MFVYIMGLADLFTAFMLVTGIKPSIILLFTAAILASKAIPSFLGKPNPILYVLGAADLLALLFLWQGMYIGGVGAIVLMIMLSKAFISFWEMKLLRDSTFQMVTLVLHAFSVAIKKTKFINKLWFGTNKLDDNHRKLPPDIRPEREANYTFNPFL
jgi:hypothetical protein